MEYGESLRSSAVLSLAFGLCKYTKLCKFLLRYITDLLQTETACFLVEEWVVALFLASAEQEAVCLARIRWNRRYRIGKAKHIYNLRVIVCYKDDSVTLIAPIVISKHTPLAYPI